MSSFPAPRFDKGALRRDAPTKVPCRVEGCANLRGTAKLVCATCWWRIPAELRVEVNAAWRRYLAALNRPDQKYVAPALKTYQEVKERAIAAAAGKQLRAA